MYDSVPENSDPMISHEKMNKKRSVSHLGLRDHS